MHLVETMGAFHSTKITDSNFRKFCRWSNGTRPTASQNRGHVLCNTGHAGWTMFCFKMADYLNIFAALERDEFETISCTILDSNDDVILLAAVA